MFAVSILAFGRHGAVQELAEDAVDSLMLRPGAGFFTRIALHLLNAVVEVQHLTAIAIGVGLYAALEATEGVGLLLRRRWAEYLTVIATGIGIPFELLELVQRLTAVRVGALAVNVAVVLYLAWRKRIFRDL